MKVKKNIHTYCAVFLSITINLMPTTATAQITNQATYARMSEKDIQLQDKYVAVNPSWLRFFSEKKSGAY